MSRTRVALAALGFLIPVMACGQNYPSKPVRIVTGAVGGGGDFASRLIMPALAASLGQPVVIDNRNASLLAADTAAKAPPDGYTVTVQGAVLWILPLLYKAPYDAVRDFAPLSLMAREAGMLAVHPSLPVKSVKDLIALAKARPGELSYSSSQVGGQSHLAMELFNSMAGVKVVHIPYKGGAAAAIGLLTGQVQLMINNASTLTGHVKAGRLRALAVTSAEPSPLVPGVPTIAATGLPGYEAVNMTCMFAPVKTAPAIVNRLNQEVVRALNQPDIKSRFFNAGSEAVGSSPEELGAAMKADLARMEKIIREANIKAE